MYLLIITGLSGAGKSQAIRKLEDMGYYCVDNLPAGMLRDFILLCKKADPPIARAAIVMDSRESALKMNGLQSIKTIREADVDYDILFLDCRDDVLERRYNETRRRHPLSGHESIKSGIQLEREMLQDLRDRARFIVDTSDLRPLELSRRLEEMLGEPQAQPFTLIFTSFGYKRGVPFEADVVLDARFSPNPFYEPELRALSGLDQPVRDFVFADPTVSAFLSGVENMLVMLIPRFIEQGKHRLMVAIGCTGGRHRSVCMANDLYQRMKGKYSVLLMHRDFKSEAAEISERFDWGERS